MFRDLELRNRVPKWRNGRREGLKNLWALARVGSTPTFGTNGAIEVENTAMAGLCRSSSSATRDYASST